MAAIALNVHLWFQEGGMMMPNMADVFFLFPHLKEYLPEEIT